MNRKQRKTLEKIYRVAADIEWNDFISLMKNLGAVIEQGRGSRCRIWFKDRAMNLHQPHPQSEIKKYAIRQIKAFLKDMEIKP